MIRSQHRVQSPARLTLGFLLVLLNSGCSSKLPLEAGQPWAVRLYKGQCYAGCAAFCVTLRSNGELAFSGETGVTAMGQRTARVSTAELESLLPELRSAGFDRWFRPGAKVMQSIVRPDGRHTVTIDVPPDVQTTVIAVAASSGVRELIYVSSKNPALADFEAAMLNLAEVADWTTPSHTPPAPLPGAGPCNKPLQLPAGVAGGS